MNYLAHIYLSGNDSRIQIGNFIGDFVKGSQYHHFPEKIQQGIRLHRKIDSFTDQHPAFKETVNIIRPEFGRYSGIVVDMYFDYFLAKDFSEHTSYSLNAFSKRFYGHTILNYRHLPERVKKFIFHFIVTNRLMKYASQHGLKESLQIMQKHKTSFLDPEAIIQSLQLHHDDIDQLFRAFLPEVKQLISMENPEI